MICVGDEGKIHIMVLGRGTQRRQTIAESSRKEKLFYLTFTESSIFPKDVHVRSYLFLPRNRHLEKLASH